MRGYFAIGMEGLSKPGNFGTLKRSAHAFNAAFAFTVNAHIRKFGEDYSDTAHSDAQIPVYEFENAEKLLLPKGCQLVGIELTDEAIELPSFRHPPQAAYVLGPERGSLSPTMLERCAHIVKIPTKFCINVGQAGVIVMYDRIVSLGRHAPRPVRPGGPTEPLPDHVRGGPQYWDDDNNPVMG
ncbi:MAG: TrmH family RNA methyltransferase [Alphaproteobacteria bacterium]